MKTPTRHQAYLPPIVPMDDAPRGMLDYAADPEGGAKIEKARQELRDGKGVAITPDYFEKMNRRVANRVAKARPARHEAFVFAPSFDQEVEAIAVYIEETFGETRRRQFLAERASKYPS